MENISVRNIVATATAILLLVVIFDAFMVLILAIGVSSGQEVQHIPFWDAQLQFFINIIE